MGLVAAYTMAGAAKGMLDVLEQNERERLREAALAAQEQMNIRAEDRAHQRKLSDLDDQRARSVQYRQEDAQSVADRAQEIADGERGLLLRGAESAYRNSGMSPQDVSAGIGAVDTARQAPADITREHRLRAARELGILGEKDVAIMEAAKDERAAAREDRRAQMEASERQHQATLAETRRYHDMLDETRNKRLAGSGLPKTVEIQARSLLKTASNLEERYYKMKPNEYDSPEDYKAEREDLRRQIGDINGRIGKLLGGGDSAPTARLDDLFPQKNPTQQGEQPQPSVRADSSDGPYSRKVSIDAQMREIERKAVSMSPERREDFLQQRGYYDLQQQLRDLGF